MGVSARRAALADGAPALRYMVTIIEIYSVKTAHRYVDVRRKLLRGLRHLRAVPPGP
jgi:hypothetical protein